MLVTVRVELIGTSQDHFLTPKELCLSFDARTALMLSLAGAHLSNSLTWTIKSNATVVSKSPRLQRGSVNVIDIGTDVTCIGEHLKASVSRAPSEKPGSRLALRPIAARRPNLLHR
jgi:hypothetical protein